MNSKTKRVILFAVDFAVAAAYVLGFYGIYYRMPRELEVSGITVQAEKTAAESSAPLSASSESAADTIISTADAYEQTSTASAETTTSPEAETSEETESAEVTGLAAKFADRFTDTVVVNDNSYTSNNISVSVEKYAYGSGRDIVTYYVADIYVSDITCIQSAFADEKFGVGYTEEISSMSSTIGAVLAINGDYYGNGSDGVVIRNGVVYRDSTDNSDVCVLYYDGTMKTYSPSEFDVEQAVSDGAYQAWSFGPALMSNGKAKTSDFNTSGNVGGQNPRTAIGYYEPGHYCFVVVDGRQKSYSVGVKLDALARIFEDLGCSCAYNLDGGKSTAMVFNGETVNSPVDGGRKVSDIIAVVEP